MMSNEEIGRIAYEAAAKATGCDQPWDDANKAKWIAASRAIEREVIERCAEAAWGHYMDTCRRQCISPGDFEQWLCSSAIRAMLEDNNGNP